ncbi:MAG: hypothetical protein M3Y73_10230 [Actinomycetota bacterium]|nr:hypothetical protein [Actinomycetota bacterium]
MRVSQPVPDDTYFVASPEPIEIIATKPPTGTRHHPRWCDRQHCITGDDGTRHTSTPTRLTTGEQIFALTLIQHDPHCAPELLIEVTDTADPDGLHVLTLPEIKALAETLLIEYLKAAALVPAARNPSTTTLEVTRACHAP